MSEHKAWYRNPEKQGWYAGCACDWQSVDMRQGSRGVVFATEADARAAYADHVYSAVGREAVEVVRDLVKPCGNVEDSRSHYRRARILLAAIDEALRRED